MALSTDIVLKEVIIIEIFLNDKYKLLKLLNEKKVEVGGEYISIITQEQIAKKLQFGKCKVNRIIKELLIEKYLDGTYNNNGSYKLTEKTIVALKKIEEVGEELNDIF